MKNFEIISNAVQKHEKLILDAERYIWANPETGYKEFKTTAYLAEKYEALGYELVYADGITGFYTTIDTGREGPTVMILGELDSVICPGHKDADPVTGAVHSCGHNAQSATLLGIAAALKEPGMLDGLSGKIKLCAVPAEELLEIEYRRELKAKGIIKYFGGKCEFLSRGYFDDVDMAFMVHASGSYSVNQGSVGCIAKNIIYKGVAAHAGGAPHNGRNALYAATCGLNAINALRETFKDDEHIRVHPIITHGGDMVNAIPERVQMESYIRGISFEAMDNANEKVNRALCGAALSLGTNIEIIDIPGYAPNKNYQALINVAKDAAEIALKGETFTVYDVYGTGSTDMGDLSRVMPTIHPNCKGAIGKSHGADYEICDPKSACVENAKWQLTMLALLLEDGAKRAYAVKETSTPPFASIKEYLEYKDTVSREGERIIYGDGKAEIIL